MKRECVVQIYLLTRKVLRQMRYFYTFRMWLVTRVNHHLECSGIILMDESHDKAHSLRTVSS
jgi:hypothetical protein